MATNYFNDYTLENSTKEQLRACYEEFRNSTKVPVRDLPRRGQKEEMIKLFQTEQERVRRAEDPVFQEQKRVAYLRDYLEDHIRRGAKWREELAGQISSSPNNAASHLKWLGEKPSLVYLEIWSQLALSIEQKGELTLIQAVQQIRDELTQELIRHRYFERSASISHNYMASMKGIAAAEFVELTGRWMKDEA